MSLINQAGCADLFQQRLDEITVHMLDLLLMLSNICPVIENPVRQVKLIQYRDVYYFLSFLENKCLQFITSTILSLYETIVLIF